MQRLIGNQVVAHCWGREVLTLRDILPDAIGLRVLFVGKTPTPSSVEAGHYFQGSHGTMFWNRLKQYGLLKQATDFEDDSLVAHGYGLTDIAKVPRPFKHEPSTEEYKDGASRILELIRVHHPEIVVFVYKKVLDEILRHQFANEEKSVYGFNPSLEPHFGSRVFAFPLPGTPCTTSDAKSAMQELAIAAAVIPRR